MQKHLNSFNANAFDFLGCLEPSNLQILESLDHDFRNPRGRFV